jgi:hypothetical protein
MMVLHLTLLLCLALTLSAENLSGEEDVSIGKKFKTYFDLFAVGVP